MSWVSRIGWGQPVNQGTPWSELPEIFPFPMGLAFFVETDVVNIYSRILTDVLERTEGIPNDKQALLWDNCLGSESADGLVTMIAKAMSTKGELFLIYDKALSLIRKAKPEEQSRIQSDYKTGKLPTIGVYISFKNFDRSDFIRLYSALEHATVSSLYKNMNLAKAIQIKISKLRESISEGDSVGAQEQGTAIATHLSKGGNVLLDGEDDVVQAKPDLTATESSVSFIAQKQSFYLGLPASWISGLTKQGLGDSGKSDAKAVERGLRPYYYAIVKPVLETLFGIQTSFKSDDIDSFTVAAQVLQTLEATSEQLMSLENKTKVINKVWNLPADAKGDPASEPTTPPQGGSNEA